MKAKLLDLGRMEYRACVEAQTRILEEVVGGAPDTLVFVEHDPVLTLGANFHEENLLMPRAQYVERGIAVEATGRGGDVTYHGPKQLVIYPIFNLANQDKDLHRWIRGLEETMILTAAAFGIEARRFPPNTGAWVGDRKLAAIGIRVRRWVSMHGIALNCDNDLAVFETFVPCGIKGYGVTSLTEERGERVTMEAAKPHVLEAFARVFDARF